MRLLKLLLTMLLRLLNWRRWRARARDAEAAAVLADETRGAQSRVDGAGSRVERPDRGTPDDLLG